MRIRFCLVGWLGIALLGASQAASAATVMVHGFAPNSSSTPGVWKMFPTASSGAAAVSLQSGGPLGDGAARLTTANSTSSKVDVGINGTFGTAGTLLASDSDFSVSYSFLAHAGPNGVTAPGSAPAPALKLVFQTSPFQTTTLVYEPYYQGPVQQDTWTTATITATSGKFWKTGDSSQTNKTLNTWLAELPSNAQLVSIRFGLGTYNADQTGYFDAVTLNGVTGGPVTYDFEPTPEPSTLALGAIAMGLMGVQALRRRRSRA